MELLQITKLLDYQNSRWLKSCYKKPHKETLESLFAIGVSYCATLNLKTVLISFNKVTKFKTINTFEHIKNGIIDYQGNLTNWLPGLLELL